MTKPSVIADVTALQRFQAGSDLAPAHELTCGRDSRHPSLVAYVDRVRGRAMLRCDGDACDYTQDPTPLLPAIRNWYRHVLDLESRRTLEPSGLE